MKNAKVSVIVPIYKVEKYLVQCLDSIVNQTLDDIEIILVDEGDLDACRYIIDHYEQTDSRVKTIHEKNGGYGASVNKGLDIATGEYISIIESDDFIEPTMFEEMYNYAKELDADVVKTPYYEYWDKTKDYLEKKVPCCWYKEVVNLPQNCTFSIEEHPILVAIHPSIWAALYKNSYLHEKNIRCIEAKGAGYIDNHFRLQTLCQTNKIAWLNQFFNYYRLTNTEASTVLYDLGTFIQRWADVHTLFSEKFPEKYKILAPYCIKEEYVNTFYRFLHEGYKINEAQKEILISNLSKTTEKQIKDSTLRKSEKKAILSLKNNPKKLNKYIKKENRTNEDYIISFCGLQMFTMKNNKKNTNMIKLFGIFSFLKTKKRTEFLIRGYLFGIIPIIKITKINNKGDNNDNIKK